jgi:hypothetical protein
VTTIWFLISEYLFFVFGIGKKGNKLNSYVRASVALVSGLALWGLLALLWVVIAQFIDLATMGGQGK